MNQARVHAGYHYPRSYLTALRSRINAPRFIADYRDCIFDRFSHYYAIARAYSNVTAAQFQRFCERIGAPLAPAPDAVRRLFADSLIEQVFEVPEVTFDAAKLRDRLARDLAAAGVTVRLGTRAAGVRSAGGRLEVAIADSGERLAADEVFNCTYSQLNRIHAASSLPLVSLKHELTEMPLVEPPAELANGGVTVMCGPFFSMIPYPARGAHTLSHVRYTPHRSWQDRAGEALVDGEAALAHHPASAFARMVRDAARFLPAMARCRQLDSLWEVKTVLPRSEVDDSRPILVSRDHGLRGFHCVTGSKIDNVYDMVQFLDAPKAASA